MKLSLCFISSFPLSCLRYKFVGSNGIAAVKSDLTSVYKLLNCSALLCYGFIENVINIQTAV